MPTFRAKTSGSILCEVADAKNQCRNMGLILPGENCAVVQFATVLMLYEVSDSGHIPLCFRLRGLALICFFARSMSYRRRQSSLFK
jgi:hypothetical protein